MFKLIYYSVIDVEKENHDKSLMNIYIHQGLIVIEKISKHRTLPNQINRVNETERT